MPFEFAFIMKRTTCYLNKYKKVELFYNIFSIEDKGEHLLCIFTLICSHFDHFWSIYATSLVALPVIYHTRAPVLFPSLTSDLSVKEVILMYLEPQFDGNPPADHSEKTCISVFTCIFNIQTYCAVFGDFISC